MRFIRIQLLTYIYSHTYGDFTAAGNAVGLETWTQYWSDIWFLVAQAGSWLYEHGTILDVNSNREGFIEQMAEEFVAAMKLYHETYGQSSWIKDWNKIGTHSIIDSADGGKTGNLFSVEPDEHEEEINRFLGKFRACNRANQMVLLNTLDFLAEQLLALQGDDPSD